MPHIFFRERRPHNGMTYKEFYENFEKSIQNLTEENTDANKLKLNFQRISRIQKSYKVSDELCTKVKEFTDPQIWLTISENWCGDSAQIIPYLAKISECNPKIDFRIIERDKNLDIIDLYLTNGTRSIPKLIAFDENGNELFQWGPRPKRAIDLINNAKAEGKTKDEFLEMLHLWYAKDRGKSLEEEFNILLDQLLAKIIKLTL